MLELRDPEASVGHSFLVLSLLSLYTGWLDICLETLCVSNQKDYSKQIP